MLKLRLYSTKRDRVVFVLFVNNPLDGVDRPVVPVLWVASGELFHVTATRLAGELMTCDPDAVWDSNAAIPCGPVGPVIPVEPGAPAVSRVNDNCDVVCIVTGPTSV